MDPTILAVGTAGENGSYCFVGAKRNGSYCLGFRLWTDV